MTETISPDETGLPVHETALNLADAARTPLGKLFQRWNALQSELKALQEKRQRAEGLLNDRLIARMIAEAERTRRAEAADILDQVGHIPSRRFDDVLYKLAMWRMSLEPIPGKAPAHTAAGISAFDDLMAYAERRQAFMKQTRAEA